MREEFDRCLLCQHPNLLNLANSKPWLVRCRRCHFVFSKWIPSEAELTQYYSDYSEYDFVNEITLNRYRTWIDGLEKYRQTNRMLDVGCGEGIFLAEAAAKNWEVHGTEYADKWIERGTRKGIQMKKGKLDRANYPGDSFDVIAYLEVIEHLNNPSEEVGHVHALLRKGGIVFVTTPNYNSLTRYLLGTDWNVITYPEHLAYYSPTTLNKLFSENGFRKIAIHTKGVSPGRILSSIRMKGKPNVNPSEMIRETDQALRKKLESGAVMRAIKNSINGVLNGTRLGDSMHAWFEKL